jgi:hypothetical protein
MASRDKIAAAQKTALGELQGRIEGLTQPPMTFPYWTMKSQIQTARALHLSLVLTVLIAGCDGRKNVCPIDGQPAQGLWRRNGQSCEYFHYSVIEKKTHSWWAECSQD